MRSWVACRAGMLTPVCPPLATHIRSHTLTHTQWHPWESCKGLPHLHNILMAQVPSRPPPSQASSLVAMRGLDDTTLCRAWYVPNALAGANSFLQCACYQEGNLARECVEECAPAAHSPVSCMMRRTTETGRRPQKAAIWSGSYTVGRLSPPSVALTCTTSAARAHCCHTSRASCRRALWLWPARQAQRTQLRTRAHARTGGGCCCSWCCCCWLKVVGRLFAGIRYFSDHHTCPVVHAWAWKMESISWPGCAQALLTG